MKFTIVTPSYNLEKWLPATIESVISQQGDFEIEYIIVDGGSTDQSVKIAREYADKIKIGTFPIACRTVTMLCVEEKNTGMYEAINRGFARATGDIYAWINSDDTYEKGAFESLQKCFENISKAQWVKGITSTIDENGTTIRKGIAKIYHQDWLAKGIYGQEAYFVEQDSVFWRAGLWKKIGGMPATYRRAADYWLWMEFARHAPLYSLNKSVSSFRKREGQLSKSVDLYKEEQKLIRPTTSLSGFLARLFFATRARITKPLPFLEFAFKISYPILFAFKVPVRYVELKNGVPIEKKAFSYIIRPR